MGELTQILALIQKQAPSAADMSLLAGLLNQLIIQDFESLVQLLYRVDVPEKKVRQLLRQQPGTDAGLLLAELLIARQREKAATRKRFKTGDGDIPAEDRW